MADTASNFFCLESVTDVAFSKILDHLLPEDKKNLRKTSIGIADRVLFADPAMRCWNLSLSGKNLSAVTTFLDKIREKGIPARLKCWLHVAIPDQGLCMPILRNWKDQIVSIHAILSEVIPFQFPNLTTLKLEIVKQTTYSSYVQARAAILNIILLQAGTLKKLGFSGYRASRYTTHVNGKYSYNRGEGYQDLDLDFDSIVPTKLYSLIIEPMPMTTMRAMQDLNRDNITALDVDGGGDIFCNEVWRQEDVFYRNLKQLRMVTVESPIALAANAATLETLTYVCVGTRRRDFQRFLPLKLPKLKTYVNYDSITWGLWDGDDIFIRSVLEASADTLERLVVIDAVPNTTPCPNLKMKRLTDFVFDGLTKMSRTYISCFASTLEHIVFRIKGEGYQKNRAFRFEKNLPKLKKITLLYIAPHTPNLKLVGWLQSRYPHARIEALVVSSFGDFIKGYMKPHCVDVDLVTNISAFPWKSLTEED